MDMRLMAALIPLLRQKWLKIMQETSESAKAWLA